MVEPLAWRFTVRRGVRERWRQVPELAEAARNARNKVRVQTLFLAEKVALLRERRTGTPKAVPRYGTTRDHQNHGFTLQVAPGSNRLSVRRL
jgi:hypothetical protein